MLSPKQKEIIQYCYQQKDKTISKRQAVALIGGYYYYNASKHVGEVLARMVAKGLLVRMRRGMYRLKSGSLNSKGQGLAVPKGQLSLFSGEG